jgi:hypothetical protein
MHTSILVANMLWTDGGSVSVPSHLFLSDPPSPCLLSLQVAKLESHTVGDSSNLCQVVQPDFVSFLESQIVA